MTSVDSPAITATPEEQEEFDARLEAAREREKWQPTERFVGGKRIIWAPQPGSQTAFMECSVFEALYHGTRGNGKTDALLMAYAQHVGSGLGRAWRGVIFRETYPQLGDVVAKSERWFYAIFPRAQFNRSRMEWTWPTGETLMFRHMARVEDYRHYHGHELPFIGFEELANWSTPDCYQRMFSCCRSSDLPSDFPRMIRATTNPWGVGATWIKDRFRLSGRWRDTIIITDAVSHEGYKEKSRCAIHGTLRENRALLEADPDYEASIAASVTNPSMLKAWLEGDWDVPSGGMFADVWSQRRNCVVDFEVPRNWRIDRSFDWGSSAPFSVGWWAESDGSDLKLPDGRWVSTVRGVLFRMREYYGWSGQPNQGLRMLAVEVAEKIVEREILYGWRKGNWSRVFPGAADSAIYAVENGRSIAVDMQQPVRIDGTVYSGVQWLPADKRPGSRKRGWEMVRKMMKAAQPPKDGVREHPALFVVAEHCPQFLRTMLAMPRDEKDLDDIPKDCENHIADEVRYRVAMCGATATVGRTYGLTS